MSGWWAASYAVLWVLVIVLALVVVALARQIGTLHLRLGPRGALEIDDEGPPLGEAPPLARAVAVDGTSVTIGGPGAASLLLFASPGCLECDQVLPSLPVVAKAAGLETIVITDVDSHETERAFASKHDAIPIVPAPDVVQTYRVPGTPYLVVLDDHGMVRAKGTINNLEQMEGLVETGLRRTRDHEERQAS
ncbi:MAG: hypothetical protein M3238_02465 [Actinomycetota bacterium]|nr:hypothetical protein [Actinomycetota bacterium]